MSQLCAKCFTTETREDKDDSGADCFKCPDCGDVTYAPNQVNQAIHVLELKGHCLKRKFHADRFSKVMFDRTIRQIP